MLGPEKEQVRGDWRRMAWSAAPRFFSVHQTFVLNEGRSECGEFMDERGIAPTLRVRAQKRAVLIYFAAEADFS
jgi:hypothetical protein